MQVGGGSVCCCSDAVSNPASKAMGTRGTDPVDISSLLPLVPQLLDPTPMLVMLQSPLIFAVTVNSCGATRESALCAVVVGELFGRARKGCAYPADLLLLPPLAAGTPASTATAGAESEPLPAASSSTFFSSRYPPRSSFATILANGPVRGLQCKLRTPTVTCGPPHPTLLAGLREE